jgi:hypothetical protein
MQVDLVFDHENFYRHADSSAPVALKTASLRAPRLSNFSNCSAGTGPLKK